MEIISRARTKALAPSELRGPRSSRLESIRLRVRVRVRFSVRFSVRVRFRVRFRVEVRKD